jgi:hypothetical protein
MQRQEPMIREDAPPEMIERAVAPHDPPVAGHAADEREISLLDLGIIIAENKRMVLNLTAAFAILAIIVSLLLPVSYTATTTLLPPQEGGSMAGFSARQPRGDGCSGWWRPGAEELQ